MNIDVMESLLESWLHICKKCQIVQNHWTVLSSWNEIDYNNILEKKKEVLAMLEKYPKIKDIIPAYYYNKKIIDSEKPEKIFSVFKSLEFDIVGINYGIDENNYYILETAFHGDKLHYNKNSVEDNQRIYKKLFYGGLVFYIYVAPFIEKNKKTNLILDFSSPKVVGGFDNYQNDDTYKLIVEFLKELFKKSNIIPQVTITINNEFKENIYKPLIKDMHNDNVNSALFIRSLKLNEIVNEK